MVRVTTPAHFSKNDRISHKLKIYKLNLHELTHILDTDKKEYDNKFRIIQVIGDCSYY